MIIVTKYINSHKNRGLELENIINRTIKYINSNNLGLFYKFPTPNKIIKSNKDKNISVFKEKSFLDYVGLKNSKFIAIEAKETKSEIFYLENIKSHQLETAEKITKNKGSAYFLIGFMTFSKFYLVDFLTIKKIIKNNNKSIKLEYAIKHFIELKLSNNITLNFIDYV